MSNSLPGSKIDLYADDTAIFCKGKTWQEVENKLQSQFNAIMGWLQSNSMYLNVTKVMMFGMEKIQGSISIQTNDGQLELVCDLEYLGVILESSLKWTKQIDSVVTKIYRINGIIRKNKVFNNRRKFNWFVLFINTSIHWLLQYGRGNTCQ